jgi:hypothetical protein
MLEKIRRFFRLLRALVGLQDDIEKIVKPITSITRKLEKLAQDEKATAADAEMRAKAKLEEANRLAQRANTEARARRMKADQALDLAAKYSGLTAE